MWKKTWADPVEQKVISTGILAAIGWAGVQWWALIKSVTFLYQGIKADVGSLSLGSTSFAFDTTTTVAGCNWGIGIYRPYMSFGIERRGLQISSPCNSFQTFSPAYCSSELTQALIGLLQAASSRRVDGDLVATS